MFIYLLLDFFMLKLPNPSDCKKMWLLTMGNQIQLVRSTGQGILLLVLTGIEGKAYCYYQMLCAIVLCELLNYIGFSGDGFHSNCVVLIDKQGSFYMDEDMVTDSWDSSLVMNIISLSHSFPSSVLFTSLYSFVIMKKRWTTVKA